MNGRDYVRIARGLRSARERDPFYLETHGGQAFNNGVGSAALQIACQLAVLPNFNRNTFLRAAGYFDRKYKRIGKT